MADLVLQEKVYEKVLADTVSEFPDFKIVQKRDSRFMKLLSLLLFFNRGFMTDYITTIGSKMYVPAGWTTHHGFSKAAVLRHERIHLRQQKQHGFLVYALMYTLVLPVVWTLRSKLEKEAYAEQMSAWYEYHGGSYFTPLLKRFVLKQFTSSAYAWMCPFQSSMSDWYDETLEGLQKKNLVFSSGG